MATTSTAEPATATATATSITSSSSSSIFSLLHPSSYLSRFLSSSLRDDGRDFTQFRNVNLIISPLTSSLNPDPTSTSTSTSSSSIRSSSAMMTLGGTSILTNITPEISPTTEEFPNRGYIISNVEIGPISNSKFRSGPPNDEAMRLTSALNAILDSSSYLPLTSLNISPGVASWCLYLDVTVLSWDSGVLDAAVLGTVAALRDVRLPKATLDPTSGQILCSPLDEDSHPLDLRGLPLTCTFGVWEGKHLLSDPTSFETSFLSSSLNLTLSSPSSSSTTSTSTDNPPQLQPTQISLSGLFSSVHLPETHSGKQDSELVKSMQIKGLERIMRGEGLEKIKLDSNQTVKVALARSRKRWGELKRVLEESERVLAERRK